MSAVRATVKDRNLNNMSNSSGVDCGPLCKQSFKPGPLTFEDASKTMRTLLVCLLSLNDAENNGSPLSFLFH